jgi:RNA polymerase sigma factor (TIGR02999 family)
MHPDSLQMEAPTERSGDALFEEVYQRLKAMAGKQLARKHSDSINTTGLVHELYLRMAAGSALNFRDPAQFFDYAAKAMRHIVIDRARARTREKRGGADLLQVDLLSETLSLADLTAERALEIDDALCKLEVHSPRCARIVELHFFAGLPLDQVAGQLKISTRTVNREWRVARAFLHGVAA